MTNIKDQKIFTIGNLVTIVIFVAGMAAQWGVFNFRLNKIEKDLDKNNLYTINEKLDNLIKSFDKFLEQYERDKSGHN